MCGRCMSDVIDVTDVSCKNIPVLYLPVPVYMIPVMHTMQIMLNSICIDADVFFSPLNFT